MMGQHPRWSFGWLFAVSVTTIAATKREPQRGATGEIATPTPTDRSTSYPGGGALKKNMAAASPIFRPARSANHNENRANQQKKRGCARDLDSCIPVAVPRVALEGSLRPPKTP